MADDKLSKIVSNLTDSRVKTNEQKIINDILDIVITYVHPSRVIMFGSRVGGKARKYSDYDIAVEGVEMDIRKERHLKDALDRKMGILTVDLINLDKADEEFNELISQKGKIIYEC